MAIKNDSEIQAYTSPLQNNTSLLITQQKDHIWNYLENEKQTLQY